MVFRWRKSAFLDALRPNSKDLMDISEDFRSIAGKYALVSFVEQDVYRGTGSVVSLFFLYWTENVF
jgi:hypothetical protein